VILCDTGIIVAGISPVDSHHRRAMGALAGIHEPLVTTWPCMTEAMHLLDRYGAQAQELLRRQIERGIFIITTPRPEDALRICALMRQYGDAPMDFADASLVVAAEVLGLTGVLTLDHHFYAYRINGKIPFDVSP
jgi:predicted nucleic acid-binding protein